MFTGQDEKNTWTWNDRQLSQEFKLEGLSMFLLGSWLTLLFVVANKILATNESSFTKCARRKSCGIILMTIMTMFVLGNVEHEMFKDIMKDYINDVPQKTHTSGSESELYSVSIVAISQQNSHQSRSPTQ